MRRAEDAFLFPASLQLKERKLSIVVSVQRVPPRQASGDHPLADILSITSQLNPRQDVRQVFAARLEFAPSWLGNHDLAFDHFTQKLSGFLSMILREFRCIDSENVELECFEFVSGDKGVAVDHLKDFESVQRNSRSRVDQTETR